MCTFFLNTGKDTLTFSSCKEFHVIILLWRTKYFVLDLFRRKILICVVVGSCMKLIISKKSTLFLHQYCKCNNWKMKFETRILYWSESLRILLLSLILCLILLFIVCMFIVRKIIFCTYISVFWRTKNLEVEFLYVPCHASIPYDMYSWIREMYNVLRIVLGKKLFS